MFILVFGLGIAAVSCDNGTTNVITDGDSVKIVSVTPSMNLIDGVEQQFTVIVDWSLSSFSEGQLIIAFNTEEWTSWIWSSVVIVEKGRGKQTFIETVIPKDYFPETGSGLYFAVMVHLLPLHPSDDGTYTILDLDIMSLRFASHNNAAYL